MLQDPLQPTATLCSQLDSVRRSLSAHSQRPSSMKGRLGWDGFAPSPRHGRGAEAHDTAQTDNQTVPSLYCPGPTELKPSKPWPEHDAYDKSNHRLVLANEGMHFNGLLVLSPFGRGQLDPERDLNAEPYVRSEGKLERIHVTPVEYGSMARYTFKSRERERRELGRHSYPATIARRAGGEALWLCARLIQGAH